MIWMIQYLLSCIISINGLSPVLTSYKFFDIDLVRTPYTRGASLRKTAQTKVIRVILKIALNTKASK